MLNYIVRRTFYSILVIFGVVIITFVLFRVAAGDPAAALLGKNPSPAEVENLRRSLSFDKPFFWGSWRRTEAFSGVSYIDKVEFPGVKIEGANEIGKGFLRLKGGSLSFKRNLPPDQKPLQAQISFRGRFSVKDHSFSSADWITIGIDLDPAIDAFAIRTADGAKFADIRKVEFLKDYGRPWDSQFLDSMKEIVSFSSEFPFVSFFNFGRTLVTREQIGEVLRRGALPSLMLMIPIFFGEMFFGIVFAMVSTIYRGTWIDRALVLLSVAGMSISYLVFIIAGQWYLGYYLNWFPVWGYGDWRYFALPILVGVASGLGEGVRFYRTIFVNELNKEYLRTAAAKGCSKLSIYFKHLLRNAAIPIITRASSVLPFLLTGSLLLESFFGIPGLGYAGINALMNSDLQMLKALVVVTAFIFVVINLFADISYAWADPRVRLQ